MLLRSLMHESALKHLPKPLQAIDEQSEALDMGACVASDAWRYDHNPSLEIQTQWR